MASHVSMRSEILLAFVDFAKGAAHSALHSSSREEVEQWLKKNGYKVFVCEKYSKRKNGLETAQ